jgi:kynurenine formamidase
MSQSNWGRWGDDDERGAANLIDSEVVLRACRTPKLGKVYELGIHIRPGAPTAAGRMPPMHWMTVDGGDFAALGMDDQGSADDYIMMPTQGTTHVDALSHLWYGGSLYNGFSYRSVRSSGASRCGIEKAGGMVTRGLLLDFVGRETAESGLIARRDIEEYLAERRIQPSPGAAVLIRTGWMDARLSGGDTSGCPVVGPDVAEWVGEHDIAILGADNEAVEATAERDEYPPLHRVLIRDLGVYMVELLDLSAPAADGVCEALFVMSPLRISRGIGSPLNPLLVS